jgi:hypothetical protein
MGVWDQEDARADLEGESAKAINFGGSSMPRTISMRPERSGGEIVSCKVGPKWTYVKIKLPTKRLRVQTSRQKAR